MEMTSLKNKKITIIGAARSGVAVAKLLKIQCVKVFVSDSASIEKLCSENTYPQNLQSPISDLQSSNIEFETGKHSNRAFECELMIISPGVPSNAPVVLEAQKRNIKVVSELEIGSWFCQAPIVAITGSNGKTTTTTLIGRILDDAKKKYVVAGNIGTAFSSVILGLADTYVAVLEVSSFQLDHIEAFRPKISVPAKHYTGSYGSLRPFYG